MRQPKPRWCKNRGANWSTANRRDHHCRLRRRTNSRRANRSPVSPAMVSGQRSKSVARPTDGTITVGYAEELIAEKLIGHPGHLRWYLDTELIGANRCQQVHRASGRRNTLSKGKREGSRTFSLYRLSNSAARFRRDCENSLSVHLIIISSDFFHPSSILRGGSLPWS